MKLTLFSEKLMILSLTLLAFLLRAYRLDAQSYWIDEAWTIFYAHLSLSELWDNLRTIRAAPPLYHLLTIYWVKLAGDGEYALRFLSLASGVLAVPLVYRLGQALGDRRVGLLTALLLTVSPYQIWHAQDARNYSMLTAASIMSMWSFINLWRREGRRWRVVYVAGTMWAVLTHYHGLVIIGVQGLFFLFTWRRHRRYYLPWAGLLLATLLPVTAWLVFGSRLWQSQHWLPQVGLGTSYLRSAIAYSVGELTPRPQALGLTAVFILLYLIGLTYAAQRRWAEWRGREMVAFLLAYTLAPNLAIWLYSQLATSVYLERYLIPVQVGYLLTIAIAILAVADAAQWFTPAGVPNPRPPYKGRFFAILFETWMLAKKIGGQARLVRPPQPPTGGSRSQQSDFTRPRAPMGADFSRRRRRVPPGGGVGGATAAAEKPGRHRQNRSCQKPTPAPRLPAALAILLLLIPTGVSLWILYHHYHDPAYAKPDWRGVVQTIETYSLPGDAILLTGDGGEKLFDYYYAGDLPVYDDFNTPVPPPDQVRQRLGEIAAGHQRLWYTPYGVDIDPVLENWLAENAYPAWHSWIGRKRLALYDTSFPAERVEKLEATFAGSQGQVLHLTTAVAPKASIPAGDLLPLTLTWQAETPLVHDYQLSLRLINDRGDIFVQSDWPPLPVGSSTWSTGQPVADHRSLWLPADVPPGDYALQLVLYEPKSGASLGQPALIPHLAVAPARLAPPVEALAIPNPGRWALGDLTLVGYAAPEAIQPGQEMWLWLYWQAQSPLDPQATIRLSLESEGERSSADFLLSDSTGSPETWRAGQVRRAVYHAPTSPRLAGRQALVTVALIVPGKQTQAQTILTTIDLDQRPRSFERPALKYSTDVALGPNPQLKLIGYDLPATEFAPGAVLPLTLYWQAEAEMTVDYTVFVQLLDDAQQVVAQVDLPPQAGAAPTTTWLPGEIITDPYILPLPPDLPPGDYRLITGLYEAGGGDRLPLTAGGDFVELASVRVGRR